MKPHTYSFVLALPLLLATHALAQQQSFKIDPQSSEVAFTLGDVLHRATMARTGCDSIGFCPLSRHGACTAAGPPDFRGFRLLLVVKFRCGASAFATAIFPGFEPQ